MKRILATTTILALSAGFASAEVTLSGDARMGIISGFGGADTAFTSRARVKFSMSGTTDGGLEFGASFRADNAKAISDTNTTCIQVADGPDADTELDLACTSTTTTTGGANAGTAGEVHISGAFGKLSMGDVDGAAQAAVGQVSGVGLTGLSDLNEIVYLAAGDGASDPTALYEYSSGSFTGYLSVTNPGVGDTSNAIGAKYATDAFSVSVGFEDAGTASHVILGGSATFGTMTAKLVYGMGGDTLDGFDQMAMSVDYTADALTVTGFYATTDFFGIFNVDRYGVGASYDLGGGASVVGGYADVEGDSAFDLGLSFSF
jgi:outer membrane protein OmpU